MDLRRLPIVLAALLAAAGLIASCGSSKPGYCDKVDSFKGALDDLKNVDVKKNGPDEVVSAVKKVKTTGDEAVAAVKSDYAPQADALKSSLKTLGGSVRQLAETDKREAALARIPGELDAVTAAYNGLADKTDSKCK